ncbi:MAG: hypothetical protein HY760_08270 [Nitrospirae bacterium]|nr:hypothetical protein [Nitrospirota bacterium]
MIALLRILPQTLHLLGFRVVLSFLFRQYPEIRSLLSKMEGKTILLEAVDIHKKYPLHVRGERIVATWRGWQSPDVVMRGVSGEC